MGVGGRRVSTPGTPPRAGTRPGVPPDDALLQALERQARWCDLTSPFSARVLRLTARWLTRAGDAGARSALAALRGSAADPLAAAVPLRWLAGLHRLALDGAPPWALLWPAPPSPASPAASPAATPATSPAASPAATTLATPSADAQAQPGGGTGAPTPAHGTLPDTVDDETVLDAIAQAWQHQPETLRQALASPPQTNEVQRSAVLLPGLHWLAAHALPRLWLAEIGSSAGLNLWLDQYAVETPHGRLGPADAALVLHPAWSGLPPPLSARPDARPVVGHRAGGDLAPVDLDAPDAALRLASYVWAGQHDRLQRLRTAIDVARGEMARTGVRIRRQAALPFVADELGTPRPGHTRVLMHSVVWQYLGADDQRALTRLMEALGAAATPKTPLAWLRMEPPAPDQSMTLRCRCWPGGEDHLLARAHPHGLSVEWLAPVPVEPGGGAAAPPAGPGLPPPGPAR